MSTNTFTGARYIASFNKRQDKKIDHRQIYNAYKELLTQAGILESCHSNYPKTCFLSI